MISGNKRILTSLSMVLASTAAFAAGDGGTGGAVNYTAGYAGLKDMCTFVLEIMTVSQLLLYAIAAILSVYSSCSIYIKMNTGGDGITKDILMLVGSAIFLIASMTVLPAFFGINFANTGWETLF